MAKRESAVPIIVTALEQAAENVIAAVQKHRLIKGSDLVGWFGQCSCRMGGWPFDIENEEDYYEHLRQVLKEQP